VIYPGERLAMPSTPRPPSSHVPGRTHLLAGRVRVPGIGQRIQPEEQSKTIMEEMATLIYHDAAGRSLLDPNTLKDMPAWD
jgi:hypothetical protein